MRGYHDDELENGPREREYRSERDPDELYETARERAWEREWQENYERRKQQALKDREKEMLYQQGQ